MRGKIHKIHPAKRSRNGNTYQRVEFIMEDGEWANTDLCYDYANFKRWRSVLTFGVGTILTGLNYKNKSAKKIDADSKFTVESRQEGEGVNN